MFRKCGVLALLTVCGIGVLAIAQSSNDGSVSYPVWEKTTDPEPQVAWCGWRYEYEQVTPWEYAYSIYRCNRTHRCSFFLGKGCYHVHFYTAEFDVYRKWCCYISWWYVRCGEREYVGTEWRTEERGRVFLGCGCTGVEPDQSGCLWLGQEEPM